jgi:LacI family transcriptional regulator
VAAHFIERGLRHFWFYSDSENWSQVERGEGFVKSLAVAGYQCEWLRWHEAQDRGAGRSEWLRRRAWLLSHLERTPKPVGIFTANGSLAVEVQELCAEASIAVPA